MHKKTYVLSLNKNLTTNSFVSFYFISSILKFRSYTLTVSARVNILVSSDTTIYSRKCVSHGRTNSSPILESCVGASERVLLSSLLECYGCFGSFAWFTAANGNFC